MRVACFLKNTVRVSSALAGSSSKTPLKMINNGTPRYPGVINVHGPSVELSIRSYRSEKRYGNKET